MCAAVYNCGILLDFVKKLCCKGFSLLFLKIQINMAVISKINMPIFLYIVFKKLNLKKFVININFMKLVKCDKTLL